MGEGVTHLRAIRGDGDRPGGPRFDSFIFEGTLTVADRQALSLATAGLSELAQAGQLPGPIEHLRSEPSSPTANND